MTLPEKPPQWIESTETLRHWAERWKNESAVGIDTEANSFYAYRERVCLIQLSTESDDFLIDPFACEDLGLLGELCARPEVLKIFHDGEYDIGLLKNEFGWRFSNLFDTRVAVAALGSKTPGLASVLKERFDVEVDKKFQRSDWGRRPLSEEQIRYAQLDTHYLIPLYGRLYGEVEKAGRLHIVEAECRRLENLDPKEQVFDPDGFIRLKGARHLEPLSLQVLKALFRMRDGLASRDDVPPFRIMSNEALLEIAKRLPKTSKELTHIKGVTWRTARKCGSEIFDAIETGRRKGPLRKLPSSSKEKRLSAKQAEIYDRLRIWRKKKAEAEGLDASHLLRRKAMMEMARLRPQNEEQLLQVDEIEPWQVESFGPELLQLLNPPSH